MEEWREAKMNKWKEEEEGRYNFEKSERTGRNGKLLNTTINYLHFTQKFFSCWAICEMAGLIKGFSFQQELMSSYLKIKYSVSKLVLQLILPASEWTIPRVEKGAKRWFWTHDNDHRKDHLIIWFDVQIVFKPSLLIQCIVLIFNEKKWVSPDLARLCWKSKTLFNYF